MSKNITFKSWIELQGIDTLAKLLRVEPSTVRNWRAARCNPNVAQMKQIKRFSKGLIDYPQMIERRTQYQKRART